MSLAQLMQVAPITGAGFVGEQFDTDQRTKMFDQQRTLADIAKMQQDMEFNTQNNPLRLQNSRLVNQGLEAEMPGKQAYSQSQVLDARKKQDTYAGEVAATDSNNELTLMGNQLKKYQQISDVFSQAAHEVKDLPPVARGVRLREILEQNGLKSDSPRAHQFLMEATQNPLALLAKADEAKKRAAELSPAYIQAMAQVKEQGRNSVAVAEVNERGRVTAAREAAEAKKAAAEIKAKGAGDLFARVKSGQVPPDKAAVQFQFLAISEEDPVKRQQYYDFAEQSNKLAVQLREAQGLAGKADPNAMGIQTFPSQTPVMGQNGKGPALGTKENPIKLD